MPAPPSSAASADPVCLVQARKYVLDDLNKAGKAARLRGFERISAVLLDSEAWSTDNDLVRVAAPQHSPVYGAGLPLNTSQSVIQDVRLAGVTMNHDLACLL